jgi:hypothetical protein
MDTIPGFAPGIVINNKDPNGTGRIKVRIPGVLDETPYWVMPGNWPGAGGVGKGSQYPPPPINGHVAVIFEYGIYSAPDAHAFYFTGYYGHKEDGMQAGPEIISAAPSAEEAHKRVVLWEGEDLLAYVVEDATESKLVLQAKLTGSKIEINAKDGAGGHAETIYIEARTLLSLYAKGNLDIRADGVVQIQGRPVDEFTERSI